MTPLAKNVETSLLLPSVDFNPKGDISLMIFKGLLDKSAGSFGLFNT
ncbi:hypothetical protein P0Y67_14140 [Photobacterium sp. SP02]